MLEATAAHALTDCATTVELEFHERARLFRLFGENIGPASAGPAGPAPAPLSSQEVMLSYRKVIKRQTSKVIVSGMWLNDSNHIDCEC